MADVGAADVATDGMWEVEDEGAARRLHISDGCDRVGGLGGS